MAMEAAEAGNSRTSDGEEETTLTLADRKRSLFLTAGECNIVSKDWMKSNHHFGKQVRRDYDFGANLTNMLDSIELCIVEGDMELTCLLCSKELLGYAINGDQTDRQIKENTKKVFQHFLASKSKTTHKHMWYSDLRKAQERAKNIFFSSKKKDSRSNDGNQNSVICLDN